MRTNQESGRAVVLRWIALIRIAATVSLLEQANMIPILARRQFVSRLTAIGAGLYAMDGAAYALDPPGDSVETAEIRAGDLLATFRDNTLSPRMLLSGVQSLINTKAAPDYDAYDTAGGAGAGLNFEHIISGHRNRFNRFTPRIGRYPLYVLPGGRSVMLVREAADSPWAVASTLKYTVTPPHYIDFEFTCRFSEPERFGPRGHAIFFFANYMSDVKEVALNFRGVTGPDQPPQWIAADAPPGHRDYNRGGTYRHRDAAPVEYDPNHDFRLNSWSYDWPRYVEPFYFGRAEREMTMILMFDRTMTEVDEVRFSLFKFKVNARQKRPAWDFQYVVRRIEAGRDYGFRGRVVWKRFISPEDCAAEYRTWRSPRDADG